MVHLLQEQALSVWPIAGYMNRKVLPTSRLEGMVPGHAPFENDTASVTFFALADEILSRVYFADRDTSACAERIHHQYLAESAVSASLSQCHLQPSKLTPRALQFLD